MRATAIALFLVGWAGGPALANRVAPNMARVRSPNMNVVRRGTLGLQRQIGRQGARANQLRRPGLGNKAARAKYSEFLRGQRGPAFERDLARAKTLLKFGQLDLSFVHTVQRARRRANTKKQKRVIERFVVKAVKRALFSARQAAIMPNHGDLMKDFGQGVKFGLEGAHEALGVARKLDPQKKIREWGWGHDRTARYVAKNVRKGVRDRARQGDVAGVLRMALRAPESEGGLYARLVGEALGGGPRSRAAARQLPELSATAADRLARKGDLEGVDTALELSHLPRKRAAEVRRRAREEARRRFLEKTTQMTRRQRMHPRDRDELTQEYMMLEQSYLAEGKPVPAPLSYEANRVLGGG